MRRKSLKASKEALEKALRDLEDVRMTRADDPMLTKLKADIRRTIDQHRNLKPKMIKAPDHAAF